ncbi:unnamed protein product [Thelazia callipaeda]|uniref:Piezo_RRas_bdg domain-containing protein n=1 Tax=Thelazia callipaeda TaxID=103827 RepID=A0A0N5CZI1_THECL|nr:unnamed protein product [Thelazia callipaeda]
MENTYRISKMLIIIGIANVLNAFIAGCIQAEKSYHSENYVNTHWITIITLFAGIASSICPSFAFLSTSFILATIVNIFALAICSAAVIADTLNLITIFEDFSTLTNNAFLTKIQVYGMLSYSLIDLILSVISVAFLIQIMLVCHRNFLDAQIERRSVLISVIGCALIATSTCKLFAWIFELYFLRTVGNIIRYTFIHYTIDEPLWIALNTAIGIFCILRVPAISLTRIITLCFSSLSIYPTITYLWIDYRWFTSAVIAKVAFVKWTPDWLSLINLCAGIIQILLLSVLTLTTISSFRKPLQMNFSPQFKRFLFISGITAGITTITIFAFDILSIRLEAFYKIFHGNQQKTPFLTAFSAVLLFLASTKEINFLVFPSLLCTLLFCIQSTTFLLISYLYLSWNGYYANEICEIFYRSSAWCTNYLTVSGAISHFLEALLYLFVFIACCTMVNIILKIMQISPCHATSNHSSKSPTTVKLEKSIEIIGLMLLIGGAVVFATTLYELTWNSSRHPSIVLLTSLYHISLTVTLLIFPLYQIMISHSLHANSLHCITLLMVSAIRFADILTQLDYRNTGEVTTLSWRIHNAIEVFTLGAYFATIVFCLRIHDQSNDNAIPYMPPQPFIEFRNPLSTEQQDSDQHYPHTF